MTRGGFRRMASLDEPLAVVGWVGYTPRSCHFRDTAISSQPSRQLQHAAALCNELGLILVTCLLWHNQPQCFEEQVRTACCSTRRVRACLLVLEKGPFLIYF